MIFSQYWMCGISRER